MRQLSVLVLVAGCAAGVKVSHLNPAPRPLSPRAADAVGVFVIDPPTRSYIDVALLEIEHDFIGTAPSQELLDALRRRGGEIGCDAIVIRQVASQLQHSEIPISRTSIHASCIVYTEGAGSPPAATPAAPSPTASRPTAAM